MSFAVFIASVTRSNRSAASTSLSPSSQSIDIPRGLQLSCLCSSYPFVPHEEFCSKPSCAIEIRFLWLANALGRFQDTSAISSWLSSSMSVAESVNDKVPGERYQESLPSSLVFSSVGSKVSTPDFSVVDGRIAMVLLLGLKLVCEQFRLLYCRTFGFHGPFMMRSPSSDELSSS